MGRGGGAEGRTQRARWSLMEPYGACLGSCEFPGGVNSPPRVLPSTNNGLVSTRGARRALLPHLIAHSGAGFAFSQKEDFRRSMSSWLARAADLLARVAMNRLRLACCSRASDLAIYGGLTLDAYCGRRRRSDLVPFFPSGVPRKPCERARSASNAGGNCREKGRHVHGNCLQQRNCSLCF